MDSTKALLPFTCLPELENLLTTYIKNFQSHRTKEEYSRDMLDFLTFLESTNKLITHPKTIRKLDIIEYRDYLKSKSLSPLTINRKISSLSSIFKELQDHQIIESNPASGVKRPKQVVKNQGLGFSDEEVKVMLEFLEKKQDLISLNYRALLTFMLYTGARVSEAIHIKVKDISKIKNTPVVHLSGKGSKLRTLPIQADLIVLLTKLISLRAKQMNDFVFTAVKNNSSTPLTRDMVFKFIKKLQLEVGLDGSRSCHSTRRTLVSNLLENGEKLEIVQQIAGHASPTTTVKYNVRKQELEDSPLLKIKY